MLWGLVNMYCEPVTSTQEVDNEMYSNRELRELIGMTTERHSMV
jgi:hypothetical protein